MLEINVDTVTNILENFLKQEIQKIGLTKAVIGLSGGVDSALVAALLARAIGPENVYALSMPFRESNPESEQHARLAAEAFNIHFEVHDISPMVDAFFANQPEANALRRGNKMARERMCLLYDFSAQENALVIGTSNKTELILGYGTIFGDLSSAINPIGDLYKTHVWELSRHLGVPNPIIDKPPSADLWLGQTDEQELGYSYQEIDPFLYYLVDLRYPDEILLELGYKEEMIKSIKTRITRNQFKRRPTVIAKLGNRTINQDFRYCRDWGV